LLIDEVLDMPIITTISSKNQTSVPSAIRKKFDLKPADKLEWIVKDDEIIIKKITPLSFEDMKGRYATEESSFNWIELKKKIERGE
jgi:AbrB family looped-hinge helix DNA binding protein